MAVDSDGADFQLLTDVKEEEARPQLQTEVKIEADEEQWVWDAWIRTENMPSSSNSRSEPTDGFSVDRRNRKRDVKATADASTHLEGPALRPFVVREQFSVWDLAEGLPYMSSLALKKVSGVTAF